MKTCYLNYGLQDIENAYCFNYKFVFLIFALQKADLKNIGQGSHCEVPQISVAFVNVQTVCLEALAASGMNSAASL